MTEDNGPAIRRLELLIDERDRFYNEKFKAAKDAVNLALTAAEKAVVKAEAASEKRQDASNEIRAAMIDQQKTFANRSETELRFVMMDKKIEDLIAYRSSTAGHGKGMSDLWGWIVGALAAGAAVAGFIFHGGR